MYSETMSFTIVLLENKQELKYMPSWQKWWRSSRGETTHYLITRDLSLIDPKAVDKKELLNEKSAKKFRPGLGICLYLAHDWIEVQYAAKLTCQDQQRMHITDWESWHVISGVRLTLKLSFLTVIRKAVESQGQQVSCFWMDYLFMHTAKHKRLSHYLHWRQNDLQQQDD